MALNFLKACGRSVDDQSILGLGSPASSAMILWVQVKTNLVKYRPGM